MSNLREIKLLCGVEMVGCPFRGSFEVAQTKDTCTVLCKYYDSDSSQYLTEHIVCTYKGGIDE